MREEWNSLSSPTQTALKGLRECDKKLHAAVQCDTKLSKLIPPGFEI
jgi:hypothetical protein